MGTNHDIFLQWVLHGRPSNEECFPRRHTLSLVTSTFSNKTFSCERSLILWAGKIHCKIYHGAKLTEPCEQTFMSCNSLASWLTSSVYGVIRGACRSRTNQLPDSQAKRTTSLKLKAKQERNLCSQAKIYFRSEFRTRKRFSSWGYIRN